MMQHESAKIFSPNFSFHDGYEQFAKFFAHQIFPLYGRCPQRYGLTKHGYVLIRCVRAAGNCQKPMATLILAWTCWL